MSRPVSVEEKGQLDSETAKKTLKSARVFANQEPASIQQNVLKSAIKVEASDPIVMIDEYPNDTKHLDEKPNTAKRSSNKNWVIVLAVLISIVSLVELVYFIIGIVQNVDWLASIWLAIIAVLGLAIIRWCFFEYKGLKQLKSQEQLRNQSRLLGDTAVIGLAEKHCLNIAKTLPIEYQFLVEHWQDSFDENHNDSEILSLFEHNVLAPIDKLVIKQVSKNASAASVMIAVSPFALLDMMIVLWRNVHMMNQISEIYGLHLGYWARVKLLRKIFHTMLYAGAAEILSDAGNYALGAGITGKLSTRVAQGMGAGVLTARIGLKAINECRPMPWLCEKKPGLSGISKQLFTDLSKQIK